MLWEPTDPVQALRERFAFDNLSTMSTWLISTLGRQWSLRVRQVERIVLSDHNAVAWAHTDQGTFVVKVCADASRFTRLEAIADVVTHLSEAGLPVPAPVRADDGATRVVLSRPGARNDGDNPERQSGAAPRAVLPSGADLSVIVQPLVPGTLLDARDLAGVHAAGAVLARLHHAVVGLPHPGHLPPDDALRPRLRRIVGTHASGRAPRAAARLDAMLTDLPDLDIAPQLVHRDYRSTNVLMAQAQVAAVLDFDEMRLDHRVVDLAQAAVLLATRFTTWGPTPRPARDALVAGYTSVQPLSEVERGWLQAGILALGLSQIPVGADPAGWAESVAAAR